MDIRDKLRYFTEQDWVDDEADWTALGNLEALRAEAEKPHEERSHVSADDLEPPSLTKFHRDLERDGA